MVAQTTEKTKGALNIYYILSLPYGELLVIITLELTVYDYIKFFLILAELVGIVVMVYLLVDSLRDKPDKDISKNLKKKQKGLYWVNNSLYISIHSWNI